MDGSDAMPVVGSKYAIDAMLDALASFEAPPCGVIGDMESRCALWSECASNRLACKEFQHWVHATDSAKCLKKHREYQSRGHKREPNRKLYDKLDHDHGF